MLQAKSYELQNELWYKLQAMSYELRAFEIQVTSYELRAKMCDSKILPVPANDSMYFMVPGP